MHSRTCRKSVRRWGAVLVLLSAVLVPPLTLAALLIVGLLAFVGLFAAPVLVALLPGWAAAFIGRLPATSKSTKRGDRDQWPESRGLAPAW